MPWAGQFYIIAFFCLEDGTAGDKGVGAELAAFPFPVPGLSLKTSALKTSGKTRLPGSLPG
ncbi:hypothetical protein FXV91_13785 [Methanosarcina sp. DH2]|nr:hypothetical protein [Methanosarcina sp. DH2]